VQKYKSQSLTVVVMGKALFATNADANAPVPLILRKPLTLEVKKA